MGEIDTKVLNDACNENFGIISMKRIFYNSEPISGMVANVMIPNFLEEL